MNKKKLWLCGLTGPDREKDLREAIEPIYDFFDGLVWVFHYPKDEGAEYLESRKKAGKIIYAEWVNRHDFMRNFYLYYGPMETGDWWIDLDSQETILPYFFENLDYLFNIIYYRNLEGFVLAGKRFMFCYNDFLIYKGSPHEGLSGVQNVVELTNIPKFENKELYFKEFRAEKRPKHWYINKWMSYYYCYPDSNHCFLGMEHCSQAQIEVIQRREFRRRQFRIRCRFLGLEYNIESLKKYLMTTPVESMDPFIVDTIREEKFVNDFYAYHVLGRRDFGQPTVALEDMIRI